MRASIAAALACLLTTGVAGTASAQTKINIGIVVNPSFVHARAANGFKECLDKQVPGKFDVVVHHSAVLGSETLRAHGFSHGFSTRLGTSAITTPAYGR